MLIAVQKLQNILQGKSVLFLIDNSTTVAYLRKQGGTRSKSLTKLTRRVLELAHSKGITVVARHIVGQLNVLADLASRIGQVIPSEWAVSDDLFQWIQDQIPWSQALQVDFFANQWNHRLDQYVSPCPDRQEWAIDALKCKIPAMPMY